MERDMTLGTGEWYCNRWMVWDNLKGPLKVALFCSMGIMVVAGLLGLINICVKN